MIWMQPFCKYLKTFPVLKNEFCNGHGLELEKRGKHARAYIAIFFIVKRREYHTSNFFTLEKIEETKEGRFRLLLPISNVCKMTLLLYTRYTYSRLPCFHLCLCKEIWNLNTKHFYYTLGKSKESFRQICSYIKYSHFWFTMHI